MKKLLLALTLSFSLLALAACGVDDDTVTTEPVDTSEPSVTQSTAIDDSQCTTPYPDDAQAPSPTEDIVTDAPVVSENDSQETTTNQDAPQVTTTPEESKAPETTTAKTEATTTATKKTESTKKSETEASVEGSMIEEGDDDDVIDMGEEEVNIDELLALWGIDSEDLNLGD